MLPVRDSSVHGGGYHSDATFAKRAGLKKTHAEISPDLRTHLLTGNIGLSRLTWPNLIGSGAQNVCALFLRLGFSSAVVSHRT